MLNFTIGDVISHGLLDINSVLRVNWEITPHCNYKCSYCFGNAGMKDASFSSIEDLKNIANKILEIERNCYNILLIGGEPTVHPHFLDLLKYFNSLDRNISLSIVTNGSKSIEYHTELFQSIQNKELLFNISVHLEQCRLNHIIDIIKLANEYNVQVLLSFMMHPEKLELLEEFLSSFIELRKEFYFNIMFMELRQAPLFDRNDDRYTDEHYKWIDEAKIRWDEAIKNSNTKIIEYVSGVPHFGKYNIIKDGKVIKDIYVDYGISVRNGLKSFKGFYCFGGANFINIHSDNSYSFGIQCPKFANIGNLLKDKHINYKLFEICDQYQCGCNSNDVIPKFRNIDDASDFISDNIKHYTPILVREFLKIKENEIDSVNNLNVRINNLINEIAWWIPIRKWRDSFRNKMLNTDQTRPDQTRPDQTRPDQTLICRGYIYDASNIIIINNKLQDMSQYDIAA